jgi:hypothetical protein
MSTRPENTGNSRIDFENKELRTERLHFERSTVEFEVGPVGVFARIAREDGRRDYAGPLDEATIEALYQVGERDVWADKDPHGVLPETFKIQYDSLREAAYQPSSTDCRTEPRCPDCSSPNISRRPHTIAEDPEHTRGGRWRCRSGDCRHCFDEPAPSANEEGVPKHDGCGRKLHVRRIGHARFRCDRCDEIFSKPEADE